MEAKKIETNAWRVAKLLIDMNNGAAVLNERTKAYLLEDKQGQFFFHREYLPYSLLVFLCWGKEDLT